MDVSRINLLGIDVGFSKSRPTTGIAYSNLGNVHAVKTHTDWECRRIHIPPNVQFAVVAIDGPLVPPGSPDRLVRKCEQILARGAFQKRCKPGASHFGTGLQLKHAALETASQVSHLTAPPMFQQTVLPGVAIIEAFPNAFLGVMLSDTSYEAGQIARGKKFDRMYELAVKDGLFAKLMLKLEWGDFGLLERIEAERDHERRAAYVCLLTAACAATGKAEVVGDVGSGWIWLPPSDLWAGWAREALSINRAALAG
jgi:predicted nuclease with RNAse H fold